MSDCDNTFEVGYGKPPKQTRFVKGRSGNPRGRPKGAKNLATIFVEVCQERITVHSKDRPVRMTKLEAIMRQLLNKAASGDLKAIRDVLFYDKCFAEREREAQREAQPVPTDNENDKLTAASIVRRILQSESPETGPSSPGATLPGQEGLE